MPTTGAPISAVQPGDIFVVVPGSYIFGWIARGESLIDRHLIRQQKARSKPVWGHAGVASRRLATGQLMVVQAEPGGAVEVPWTWEDQPFLWSTGILPPCPGAALAAMGYAGYEPASMSGLPRQRDWNKVREGAGYSFLDYLAIETHALHIPAPGLQHYIETTRHMICSQLADASRLAGGSHLFDDKRWPGYVTPLDIGLRLEGVQ